MKTSDLSFDEILLSLGYSAEASEWIGVESELPESSLGALLYAMQRDGMGSQVRGVYTFQTSPEVENQTQLPRRPAVWFAEATTPHEAQMLHRRLWSSGAAPFLIVTLPAEVRVYTGFNYSGKNPSEGLLGTAHRTLKDVEEKLGRFSAEQVDSGAIWSEQSAFSQRVDQHLLNNLLKLQKLLEDRNMPARVTLTLIGKFLYIRYLRDRKILSNEWICSQGLDAESIFGPQATARELILLAQALEERFGGNLFPFRSYSFDDATVQFVAGVFRGDDALSGQLALDFSVYDFSYVPVELLSAIYEAFLGQVRSARKTGAFYTPEFLADYLLHEVESVKPLTNGMRALDPACGSGVFLVLVYRHLIEKARRKKSDGILTPQELKVLLEKSVCGVEREEEACQVTQFSLILTLLHYIQPPDLESNKNFRFPILRDRQIFCADFFDEESLFSSKKVEFDWVIGNPPWRDIEPVKEGEVDQDKPLRDWLEKTKTQYPVARGRTSEAFSWRVTEFLKPDGCVGLLLPASSLTNHLSHGFRSAFFKRHHVQRITNFSNLVYKLFATAREPCISLIYSSPPWNEFVPLDDNGRSLFSGSPRPPVVHFAPLAANQTILPRKSGKRKAWSLTIYQDEIQIIDAEEAMRGESLTWKIAFWGNHRDRRALQRLRRQLGCTLEILCNELDWKLRKGLQLRESTESNEKIEALTELSDLPMLHIERLHGLSLVLEVPSTALSKIPDIQHFVRVRSGKAGLSIAQPPHIFITYRFAAYSDQPWVLPHAQIGLAAPPHDADYLRAISLFLNSSFARYMLFFDSSAWGIGHSSVALKEVEQIAVPRLTEEQVKFLASKHRQLSTEKLEESAMQNAIDDVIGASLSISENIQILVRDFVQVRLQFTQGKTAPPVMRRPTRAELKEYARALKARLDDFAGAAHQIAIETACDGSWILCAIGPAMDAASDSIVVSEVQESERYNALHKHLKQRHSQWVYVQRGLTVFDGELVYILKSARFPEWTRSRALLDSDEVISEVLTNRK